MKAEPSFATNTMPGTLMFAFRKTKRLIPLTTLIERWNKIHRDKKIVPAFWGALYLFVTAPLMMQICVFFREPHLDHGNYGSVFIQSLVFMLSIILLCILLGVKIQQWHAYSRLLPKMLEYDDLRMTPCLITAVQRPPGYFLAVGRLTRYLNELTPDDAAVLGDKTYVGLHACLTAAVPYHEHRGEYNYSYDETHLPLRLAIFRVIEIMGHTQSLPAVEKFLQRCIVVTGAELDILAAQQCRDSLISLREQVRQNANLLRPSQREASPETLLRAAEPAASASVAYLLHPAELPENAQTITQILRQ
jgi:hypothetical protein